MEASVTSLHRSWHRSRQGWLRRPAMRDVPVYAGATAMIVAAFAVVGWVAGSEQMRTVWLGIRPMRLDTAVGFLLAGVALVMLAQPTASRSRDLAIVPIVTLLGLCGLVGARAMLPLDPGVERWLAVSLPDGGPGGGPLWMSPTVLISFLSVATALLLIDRRPMVRVSLGLLVVPLVLASLNVLDLLLHDGVSTVVGSTAQMAPASAVTMMVVSVGVMALLGAAGPLNVFVGPSSAARIARQLLFAALVVPATVAWVRLQGQEYGLFGTGTGISLMVLGIVVLLAMAVWQTARAAERTETAHKAALDELDRFFEVSVDMLATLDADGRLLRINPAWTATLGYRPEDMLGHRVTEFIHPDDVESTVAVMSARFAQRGTTNGFRNRYRRQDGSFRWLEWNTAPSADGRLAYAAARDITRRRQEEELLMSQRERLRQLNQGLSVQVAHDPLTGLRNRAWFDRAYGVVITRRLRRADGVSPTSAIMFDLDHFGNLNKQYGHQAGDKVLRRFADVLRDRVRGSDITARFGGEEFVAVLMDCSRENAAVVANDIRAALEAITLDFDGLAIRTTVSAGCAALEPGMAPADLLSRADLALSMAKRAGRNTVVVA
jgi:diguanylate cyclase (GGDEF)-like protein/PAS domain S-box-containing protein